MSVCWTCKKEILPGMSVSYWSHRDAIKTTHTLCGFAHLLNEAPVPLGNDDGCDDMRWPANWMKRNRKDGIEF
jgi:hypothetical protein